jgi:hypothetical protein
MRKGLVCGFDEGITGKISSPDGLLGSLVETSNGNINSLNPISIWPHFRFPPSSFLGVLKRPLSLSIAASHMSHALKEECLTRDDEPRVFGLAAKHARHKKAPIVERLLQRFQWRNVANHPMVFIRVC